MRARAISATGVCVVTAAALLAVPASPAAAAVACAANLGFDANGDGFNDTVVGAPDKTLGTQSKPLASAGSVTIVYGASGGGPGAGSLLLTQETIGGGVSEKGDRFGAAVAVGDLNNDGCKDLAIGSPGENGAGRIVVVFGSASGMDGSVSQSLSQNSTGVSGKSVTGDRFGEALAITKVGASAALWVGMPGKNWGGKNGSGAIVRFPAGSNGGKLPTTGITRYAQGSNGVPGSAEAGDEFGKVLSGSRYSLVVGVPKEDVNSAAGVSKPDAGAVFVFKSSWSYFTQDTATPEVPDTVEGGDRFGASVAQIASCSGGANDEAIVVGAPSERFSSGTIHDAGTVAVVDLPAGTALGLTQGDGAVPGPLAEGNKFGLRVMGQGHLLLASAPYETVTSAALPATDITKAGTVFQAVMGCSPTKVPTVGDHGSFSLETDGVDGAAKSGDRFGTELALSFLNDGVGSPQLLVGAPLKADGNVLDAGRVTVLNQDGTGLYVGAGSFSYGQSDTWVAGSAKQSDQFGAAIATNAS